LKISLDVTKSDLRNASKLKTKLLPPLEKSIEKASSKGRVQGLFFEVVSGKSITVGEIDEVFKAISERFPSMDLSYNITIGRERDGMRLKGYTSHEPIGEALKSYS
jgi:hypothetical protein